MNYSLKLTKTQYLIILGTAVSGLASFVNTYDAIAKTAEKQQVCEESEDYKKVLQTQKYCFDKLAILFKSFFINLRLF